MRPYIAVIRDSFYEAFKSRVLWILLAGWTIVLCALAPMGWIEGSDFEFNNESIINRDRLVRSLAEAPKSTSDRERDKALLQVWNNLEQGFRTRLENNAAATKSEAPVPMGELAAGLNAVLKKPTLYYSTAWPTANKRNDLQQFFDDDKIHELAETDLARVNRRLVELALPGCVRPSDGNSIWFGYAGLKIGNPLPVARAGLVPFIEGIILPSVLQIALGYIGIFVAIVVTSNLIPDLFAPGSMALLLSKPISRSGLLISKFIGGIGFILLNISYLLVGLYFILGFRLQLWNLGVLWCIPIFVFTFMIYYSVSMLVGLIWKNAIVAIVMVALFWGLCTVLGITHGQMRWWAVEMPQITTLINADGQLIGGNRSGELSLWDPATQQWQVAGSRQDRQRRILGPVWMSEQKRLVFGRPAWMPFGGLQTENLSLQVLNLSPELTAGNSNSAPQDSAVENVSGMALAASSSASGPLPPWSEKRLDSLATLPSRTRRIAAVNDELLVASEQGIFQMQIDGEQPKRTNSILGMFNLPSLGQSKAYEKLTPEELVFESPLDFAPINSDGDLIVLSKHTLMRLNRSQNGETTTYNINEQVDLPIEEGGVGLLGCNALYGLVLVSTDQAFAVDLTSWKLKTELPSQLADITPQKIQASDSGKICVLDSQARVLVVSPDLSSVEPLDQFEPVSAMTLGRDNTLDVCRLRNEVQQYNLATKETIEVAAPKLSGLQSVYWWLVRPFYTINPKPSAVGNVITYALSDKDPLSFGRQTEELEQTDTRIDIWTPLWSNTLFICVMLALSCAYLHRQDV